MLECIKSARNGYFRQDGGVCDFYVYAKPLKVRFTNRVFRRRRKESQSGGDSTFLSFYP